MKYLPVTKKNRDTGFTLVELLVAITIVAILAVVGFTLFAGIQGQARDSNRRTEMDSISKAFETHYVSIASATNPVPCPDAAGVTANNPSYCPLRATWFAKNQVPVDPQGGVYCIETNNTSGSAGAITPLTGASWALADRATCPTGMSTVDGAGAATFINWMVCSHMETSGEVFCRNNQQR